MIVAGTVTEKMAPIVQAPLRPDARAQVGHRHGQLRDLGGPYKTYAVLRASERIVPVDVYVPGCPPRPEALIYGLMQLQEQDRPQALPSSPA